MNKESLFKKYGRTQFFHRMDERISGILVSLLFTHLTVQMDRVSSSDMSDIPLKQHRFPAEVCTSGYGTAHKSVEFLVRLEDVRFAQTNIGNYQLQAYFFPNVDHGIPHKRWVRCDQHSADPWLTPMVLFTARYHPTIKPENCTNLSCILIVPSGQTLRTTKNWS
jgi:hypothetical protein